MILAGLLVQSAMLVFFFGVGITLVVLKGVMMAHGELKEGQASAPEPASERTDPVPTESESVRR